MKYWVLPESVILVSRTTVQWITEVKRGLEVNKDRFKSFDMKVSDKFKNSKFSADGYISPEKWKELVDNDEAIAEEFQNVFDNPDVINADDFYQDSFDGYVNMEISMEFSGEEPQHLKVIKRMKDGEGNLIGMAKTNPILDTRLYKIEFQDGFLHPVDDNLIAENLFAQVDQ